jgi:ubiquitin-conjugating enzyme E2 M
VQVELHKGADNLMEFKVHVTPDDGLYRGGKFTFDFKVPPTYPHDPPKVLCETTVCAARALLPTLADVTGSNSAPRSALLLPRRASPPAPRAQVYHPNIDMEGHVCLNILREDWKPVLTISSVMYGLTFLMLSPNADDPLNKEAASLYESNPRQFEQIVKRTLRGGMMKVGSQSYQFQQLVRD